MRSCGPEELCSRVIDARREELPQYGLTMDDQWPSALDLMARLAGLRPRERGGTREVLASESRQHASVWEKPAG
ncbi:hypothetical protein GCM10027073_30280 [Streptomyces chlorus]